MIYNTVQIICRYTCFKIYTYIQYIFNVYQLHIDIIQVDGMVLMRSGNA